MVASCVALASALLAAACHVVPVRAEGPPGPPPVTAYDGPHGRPLAFGGGVCPIVSPHRHAYPAVPVAAFVEGPKGNRDVRPRYAYVGPHPHSGRTCFREGWHLHLEPPVPTLVWDETLDAFIASRTASRRASVLRPLDIFEGPHEGCTFAHRHGHAPTSPRIAPPNPGAP